MTKQIWVSPHNGHWRVHAAGSKVTLGTFGTKAHASSFGTAIAKSQDAEIFIQKRDGTIGERNSFGHDPFPPKG